MAGEKVQLLSLWASPYAMRAEVALVVKGVEYEKVPQDVSNKSELLLKSNPVYKKVPVLLHNGKAVCESGIIVQYVDEVWPARGGGVNLLPADPYDRAVARFWADYVDKKVLDSLFGLLKASKKTGEEKKAAEENVLAAMSMLEEALVKVGGEGPFYGGAHLGLVDVMLLPLLSWLPAFETLAQLRLPWADTLPRLEAWFAASRAHPAAAVLPEASKVTEFVATVMLPLFVN
ncbi:hypothetical protein L7F22_039525 [Adiantum nelumboides]|nr:hypothetical protein [Adiantum nelumboides]